MTRAEQIEAAVVEDDRPTRAARGLMVFLIHRATGWKVSIERMIKETSLSRKPSGRDAICGFLRELQELGYVHRHELRENDDTFGGIGYRIAA